MKPLKINTSSWHYKLAKLAGFKSWDSSVQNMCAYSLAVLAGCMLMFGLAVLIAVVGHLVINLLFAIVFSLAYQTLIISDAAIITCGVLLIFVSMVVLNLIFVYLSHRSYNKPIKHDSFISHAYKSWKNKYCLNIELINKDGKPYTEYND